MAVGELNFDGSNWNFHYTKMFQNQTEIEPIPSFPIKSKKYVSPELWPFFQARIPSLKQPKIKAIIKKNGINENDIIALLRLFGAKSINNPFVLQG
ncbi:MAG: HipA N-terminal domain-containing protein [Saprospiraceae bacterium]